MAKEAEYVQVYLRSCLTGAYHTCWVDKPSRFRVGSFITLKGDGLPGGAHRVISKYPTRVKKSELQTDWKVGGLV